MAPESPRRTLAALTSLLNFLSLYGDNLTIKNHRIPISISCVVHSFIMIMYLYHAIIYCAELNFSITEVSGPMCLLVGIFQLLAMYLCFMVKRTTIKESFEILHAIVSERK